MYTVIPTEQFEKDVKYYVKKKRYRIIYYAVRDDKEIYLLTIYYKKDDNKVPANHEIIQLVGKYCLNM